LCENIDKRIILWYNTTIDWEFAQWIRSLGNRGNGDNEKVKTC